MGCPSKRNSVRILLLSSQPLKHVRKNSLQDQAREPPVLIASAPFCACQSILHSQDWVLRGTVQFHYNLKFVREASSQLSGFILYKKEAYKVQSKSLFLSPLKGKKFIL